MNKKRYSSLENALRLLNMFTVEKPEYQVNELAEQLSIAPSTAHRLLNTLSSEGFIVKDSLSNKYRLGISIRALESVITKERNLLHLAKERIDQIVLHTNVSTSLTVIFNEATFYLYAVEVENPLFSKVYYTGKQSPLLSTSAGQVLLFGKKDIDILSYIPNPSAVNQIRNQLQTNGYIQTPFEKVSRLTTIAAPIVNKNNEIIAALEMIGNEGRIQMQTETLKKTAIDLSDQLSNLQKIVKA